MTNLKKIRQQETLIAADWLPANIPTGFEDYSY